TPPPSAPPPAAALPPEPTPAGEAAPAPAAPPPAATLPPETASGAESSLAPALTLALGAVTRRDSALGLDMGIAAGLRAGAWRPEVWLRLRPTATFTLGDTRVEVSTVDLGLGLQAPRLGPRGPHPGLVLGLSRRSFSQDATRIASGWSPTLGLSLAQPMRLGVGWSLAPTLAGARDLRRVAYRWPDGATLDHPAWELSAGLALRWAHGE
ncbi:MAG: hypothetical protein ABIO70_07250, partial [Pseudomonadota bacterium]